MREAIGGTLLIKLLMVFIVIYVAFLAIAVNYAITFRVKNQIINLIEQYEGAEAAMPYIEKYVKNVGYFRTSAGTTSISKDCNNGYCIQKFDANGRGYYYKVTAYVEFYFPVIGRLTNFPVAGETRVIYQIS